MTAVMMAAAGSPLTCMQWLVGKGANKDGMTALMLVARGGHLMSQEHLLAAYFEQRSFLFKI